MSRYRFGNTELRANKRKISVFEKSTLLTTRGRALLLPGDGNGEVEELITAGYDPAYIFGVENDPKTFTELFDFYYDTVHIVNDDIYTWMKRSKAKGSYSYLHLDLCGHVARQEFPNYQNWKGLFAPEARVRVSTFRGRRSAAQFDWESQLYDDLLLQWCRIGHQRDTVDPQRWKEHYDILSRSMDDTTRIIVGLVIMNFFFGIGDYRQYVDDCIRYDDWHLPHVLGDHDIKNITRFSYNEPGNKSSMFTVWMDLVPLKNPLRTSEQWTLNMLHKIYEQMNYQVPHFNPASL